MLAGKLEAAKEFLLWEFGIEHLYNPRRHG